MELGEVKAERGGRGEPRVTRLTRVPPLVHVVQPVIFQVGRLHKPPLTVLQPAGVRCAAAAARCRSAVAVQAFGARELFGADWTVFNRGRYLSGFKLH
jgi:hypothetical protein